MAAADAGGTQRQADPAAALAAGGFLGLACVGVIGLVVLALFVWYIIILFQVRGALTERIERA
jgi:hypothetical protein